jgi:hypothetical protein
MIRGKQNMNGFCYHWRRGLEDKEPTSTRVAGGEEHMCSTGDQFLKENSWERPFFYQFSKAFHLYRDCHISFEQAIRGFYLTGPYKTTSLADF